MKDFDLIENFILGKLDEPENALVRERLEHDSEFLKEYQEVKNIIVAIQAKGLKESLADRKIVENNTGRIISLSSRKSGTTRRAWLVAASLAMLLAFGWLLYTINAPANQSNLMAEAFYTDPGLPTRMSATEHYQFYDGMVDYKTADYEMALKKWSNIHSGIGFDTLQYYKAMSLLNLRKLNEAEDLLKDIPHSSALYNQSQWRLLEILIRQDDLNAARKLIKTLPQDIHPEYQKVQDFLIQ